MKNRIPPRIYMFASFGNFNEVPIGGGQTSARRLLHALERIGINVKTTNRHRPKSSNKLIRQIVILFWAFIDPLLFAWKIVFAPRKNSAILFIGYSGAMLPLEFVIGGISKLFGFKVIFFLKGGGADKLYRYGSSIYKKMFKISLDFYDEVFVEGEDNVKLINEISKTRVLYLPNFVENDFYPKELPIKPLQKHNFIYFGRIHKDKNILLIIDIFDYLCHKYKNIFLTIIGNGNPNYERLVQDRINNSNNIDKIKRIGKINHNELKNILRDHHFFIFPSEEPREGHSNSLNEAMSWGIVPIVSKNNFLPSIVRDEQLVVHNKSVESYSTIISSLLDNRTLFEKKSQFVYGRILRSFTQNIVESQLKKELCILFDSQL